MDASLNEHWIADLDLRRNLNQNENINAAIGFLFLGALLQYLA